MGRVQDVRVGRTGPTPTPRTPGGRGGSRRSPTAARKAQDITRVGARTLPASKEAIYHLRARKSFAIGRAKVGPFGIITPTAANTAKRQGRGHPCRMTAAA